MASHMLSSGVGTGGALAPPIMQQWGLPPPLNNLAIYVTVYAQRDHKLCPKNVQFFPGIS